MTGREIPRRLLLLASLFVLAGCAADQPSDESASVRKSSGDPLLDRYASNFRYEKSEDGSTRISSDKRSEFEGAQAQGYGKNLQTKEFGTTERAKEPWWGRQDYQGNKSWQGVKRAGEAGKESRFGSLQPSEAGKTASDSGREFGTGTYRTGRAREGSLRRLAKPDDALTTNKRATYPEPYVVGWEKQRELSLEQTKGMLGRSE